jgi:flagellin-specific chaperone FliS
MEKIDSELSSLQERSKIIMKGLKAALNFEGNQIGHRYFYHEINNFYDIFIKEADSINLKNDIVYAAKYIQFVRNNILRSKLFTIYENILKEENLFSGTQNISSEFDLIYKKYKDFDDYTKLRIPEEVKIKSLALHPLKLDYLKICEVLLSDLGSDLKLVSVKLAEEESYGIRNIHDRIHFFLSASKILLIFSL